jgi:acyl-CoA dehydrogenase
MDRYVSSWMNAPLDLYRDDVRSFIVAEIAPHQEKWRKQQHVDRELWNKAGARGLLLADIPKEYGGAGGTFANMVVFWEELIAVGNTSFGTQVHAVVAHYILNHGTAEQKKAYLPRLADGEMVAAIALTEPSAGSDLLGIRTTAVRDSESYIINGSKNFVSNGCLADLFMVVAKTDPTTGSKGISLFLVETRKVTGFRLGRIIEMIGRKGQDTCEVFFDDARVPANAILGGIEGKGFYQLMRELPYERTLVGLSAVAAIERAVRLTMEHAQKRIVSGKPLFDLQNTRFKLAEAKTQAVVARVFIDWCIEQMIDGTMESDIAAMAKWYLTEMQCKVIDECLQLFGGYGYMMESPIAQMYVDARVQKIYGGANEVMKEIIAHCM